MPASEQSVERTAVARAWRASISVALATSAYGLSFGALSVASGLDVLQTCILSLVLFSGGSQFAIIGVLGAGGGAGAAIASAAILGLRNGLYGMSVRGFLEARGGLKLLAAQLTIDESTAVGIAQQQPKAKRIGFWVTGVGIYVGWNLTTLLGALLGDLLGDPKAWGLDAAAAAAFIGLLWPRLRALQPIAVAVAAAVLAVALVPFVPPGVPVIAAALVAVVVGWRAPRERSHKADGAADAQEVNGV